MHRPASFAAAAAASRLNAVASILEVDTSRKLAAIQQIPRIVATSSPSSSPVFSPAAALTTSSCIKPQDEERALLPVHSDIIRCVAAARAGDTAGTSLEGRRLSHLDLSCVDLCASFNRSDLTGVNFAGGTFRKCTFNLSLLNECDFTDARFHHCTFLGAEMVKVDARLGRFSSCVFERCDMQWWKGGGANFIACEFKLCDMSNFEYDGQTSFVDVLGWEKIRRVGWRQSAESQKQHGPRNFQKITMRRGVPLS